MVQRIVVECDACADEDNASVPGRIVDIAIRVMDPTQPGKEAEDPVRGTLEICERHAHPVKELRALMTTWGTPLDQDARAGLVNPPSAAAKAAAKRVLCQECQPPKPLAKTSVPSHAQTQHNKTASELDYTAAPAN